MSHSFAFYSNGIARSLITPAKISFGFDLTSPSPQPFTEFQAIWDTGATGSVISQRVVEKCKLKPVGMTDVHTTGGLFEFEVYFINLLLPNNVAFPNVFVTKAPLAGRTDVLIGMDIISRGDFAVTNLGGITCFSFRIPSSETIDFSRRPNPST